MTYSRDASRQRYSSELAAYTLRQFAAARAVLDSHKTAAAKLPAINSFDYRILNITPDMSTTVDISSKLDDNHKNQASR